MSLTAIQTTWTFHPQREPAVCRQRARPDLPEPGPDQPAREQNPRALASLVLDQQALASMVLEQVELDR